MPGDDKYLHELDALDSIASADLLPIEDQDATDVLKYISINQLQNFILGNVPDLNTDVPLMQDITFSYNGSGNIEWTSGEILYAGIYYPISADSTDKIYVYWDETSPNTFYTSDVASETKWMMCYKDTTEEAVYSAFQQKIIHGGFIKANTITTNELNVVGIDDDGKLKLSEIGSGDTDDISEGTNKFAAESGADITGDHIAASIANLPATPAGAGLYCSATHLGYYSGAAWSAYIKNDGDFYFGGDASNAIAWDGSTLTVRGSLIADDIAAAGTMTGSTVQTDTGEAGHIARVKMVGNGQ